MSKSTSDAKSAAPKPTDAESLMMCEALRREDHCLSPRPSLRGARVEKTGEKLIGLGLAHQVRAKSSYPVWRRDAETGAAFALKLTIAGAKAAAAAETASSDNEAGAAEDGARALKKPAVSTPDAKAEGAAAHLVNKRRDRGLPRATSKLAAVVALLSRSGGARLAELIAATGWLAHTTRAALTGLRKRGYVVTLDRSDRVSGSVYRIEPKPGDSAGDGPESVTKVA
jgi:hypothetical protein